MKQQNKNIEELFKDKLQNIEADPGANAWANIQTGLSAGTTSATVASNSVSWASSAIVGVVITAVAVGGYFFFNNEGEKKIQPQQVEIEETTSTVGVEQSTREQNTESSNGEAFTKSSEDNLKKSEIEEVKIQTTKKREDNNKSINTETIDDSKQSAEISEEIEEKSIDQILAEHQQFLDEQAAANASSNNGAEDSKREITLPVKLDNEEKTKVEEKNSTNSSEDQFTEVARIKAEQKKIADQVVFPNVFSPDLDGTNDMFKMMVDQSIPIDNIQVSIVDLNGKIVGGFTGIYGGWDGRMPNGNLAPAGWYTYQAIIYIDGQRIPKINGFNLKR